MMNLRSDSRLSLFHDQRCALMAGVVVGKIHFAQVCDRGTKQ